jgi:lipooligosaccharide transport system ATP-binding protein
VTFGALSEAANLSSRPRTAQGAHSGSDECRPAMSLDFAVTASELTKRYGPVEAVRGVEFSIRRQECFGFLGVNGAGKTTTMKMVYCRTAKTSGRLHVLGLDASANAGDIKRRIGVVAQQNALDPELTVMENLLTYAAFFDIPRDAARTKADALLRTLSLEGKHEARIKDLSGGMQRRLVIAKALLNDPELLVLDEPTTGLDPQARLMVWEMLSSLRARGLTLVLTTHDMDEAARLCDRLAIMDEGRIFAEGTPHDLIAQYAARDVLELAGGDEIPEDGGLETLIVRREYHGTTTYLYSDDNRTLLHALAARGIDPARHVARPATLEDVFLNITGRDLAE